MTDESVETALARISEKVEHVPELTKGMHEIKENLASYEERIRNLEEDNKSFKKFKNGELTRQHHTPDNCPNQRSIKNLWWIVGLVNIPIAFSVLGIGVKIFIM